MLNYHVSRLFNLAKKLYWKARRIPSHIIYFDTLLVLKKRVDIQQTEGKFCVKEYDSNPDAIIDVLKSVSRYNYYIGCDDDTRTNARLQHGLKFYAAFEGDNVIAYLWFYSDSYRFFDEGGIFVKHGRHDLWLRDVYVVPEMRGRKVFSSFVNTVIQKYYPDTLNLYSDVKHNNKPSIKAHINLGMTVVGRASFIRTLRWFIFRDVSTKGVKIDGYMWPRKFIIKNTEYNNFIDSNRS